jgi:hypothetical protein
MPDLPLRAVAPQAEVDQLLLQAGCLGRPQRAADLLEQQAPLPWHFPVFTWPSALTELDG